MIMWTAAIAALLPIVLPYGAQAVNQLIAMFSKRNPDGTPAQPTDADWANLAMLTTTTARQQALSILKAHNIDPESPPGKAFLSLIP